MATISTSYIIGVVVAGLLLGILLPIALNDILAFTSTNATIQTLVSIVLPIIAVITLIILFIPKGNK
jgi:hypothetical protein